MDNQNNSFNYQNQNMYNQQNNNTYIPQGYNPTPNFNVHGNVQVVPKKTRKKSSVAGLIILLIILGVAIGLFNVQRDAQIEDWMGKEWFIFSTQLKNDEDIKYIEIEKIKDYTPKTEIYSTEYYYDKLSEKEKIIYKAYRYAIDNNFTYIYVDNSLISDERTPLDILVLLSLDSGFLQQNLSSTEYTSTQTLSVSIMGETVHKKIEGHIVSADNFSEERISKSQIAADELKKAEIKIPLGASETEKAEAIYDYVEEMVDFADKYEDGKNVSANDDFLYEAVFEGETNCDGFSNMYSLLCYFNEIECLEKSSEDKKGEIGHTWNAVCLDGVWYNVDCTEAIDESEQERKTGKLLSFGFSDDLGEYKTDVLYMSPACVKNIVPLKKTFNYYGNETVSFVADELRKNSDIPVIILVKSINKNDVENLAQRVANNIRGSVMYNSYKAVGGTVIWFE